MKVHFAGLEQIGFAACVVRGAGVNYGLFSVLKFLAPQFDIKAITYQGVTTEVGPWLDRNCKHVIMDSGLFSLMFGAHAGKRDRPFIDSWQDALVDFVKSSAYRGAVVEVDCQKVLGIEAAWEKRELLRKQLPDHELINVYHHEDGKAGLDRMIEFSEYIAISVPEMRALRIPGKNDYIYRLACYIKSRKPSIKIHLLGCTETALLRLCSFCDSSDSTSWQQINRYGTGKVWDGHKLKPIGRSAFEVNSETIQEQCRQYLKEVGIDHPQGGAAYYATYTMAAAYLRLHYEHHAGPQD